MGSARGVRPVVCVRGRTRVQLVGKLGSPLAHWVVGVGSLQYLQKKSFLSLTREDVIFICVELHPWFSKVPFRSWKKRSWGFSKARSKVSVQFFCFVLLLFFLVLNIFY